MPELRAVTPENFFERAWRHPGHQRIAAQSHLIPVVVAELDKLVPALPLVFVRAEEEWQIMALTSLMPGSNLFIAPSGQWNGGYVPAAVRAYPFKLVRHADRDQAVLCVHDDGDWIVAAGQGNAFFDAKGKPDIATRDMLDFLVQIEHSRQATNRAVAAVAAAAILAPWQITLQTDAGTKAVEGLFRIDETALHSLDGDALRDLRDAGGLALAYGQVFSMGRLDRLPEAAALQARQLAAQTPVPSAPAGPGIGIHDGTIRFN